MPWQMYVGVAVKDYKMVGSPVRSDPLDVECSICHVRAHEQCLRVVFNRPIRVRAKGPHYERRRDAHYRQAALNALTA